MKTTPVTPQPQPTHITALVIALDVARANQRQAAAFSEPYAAGYITENARHIAGLEGAQPGTDAKGSNEDELRARLAERGVE